MISFLLSLALMGDVSITLHGIGITKHGLNISEYGRDNMERKLTSDAAYIWHPEIGLTLKTRYWQTTALYINDCFGNHAGTVLTGPKIDFLTYFSIGAIMGLYARERPGATNDMLLLVTFKGLDLIPVAAATGSVKIPIKDNLSLETNMMSNGFISHGNLGLRIDF